MKIRHILSIILLAVFLMPSGVFACGNNHSEMKCCSKEISSKATKKDCCKKESQSKNKENRGCNGKCGGNLCSTSSLNIAVAALNLFDIQNNNFNFSVKKQKFYSSESFTSDGYSSLWLIPKIS